MRLQAKANALYLLLLFSIAGCGGGGGSESITKTIDPPVGNIEGLIVAPVGGELAGERGLAAATPQPGYIGLADATVTATCGTISKSAKTQAGAKAGFFSITGLPAGTCSITTSKAGYTEKMTVVSVEPNATTTVSDPSGTTMLPVSSGSITVTANMPGGELVIDGKETGIVMSDVSYALDNISPGNHAVSLKTSGFMPVAAKTVAVKQGASTGVEFFIQILNERMFFVSSSDGYSPTTKIKMMNADGSNQEVLSPVGAPGFAADREPSPSGDGKLVVFVSIDENGVDQLFIMNSDGTNRRRITSEPYWVSSPAFSYDSKYIVAVKGTKNRDICFGGTCNELVIYDTNGNLIRQLTNDEYNEIMPTFSPDGKHVLFVSQRPSITKSDIYQIDVDGKNEKRLTNLSGTKNRMLAPTYSPDGKKILFYTKFYEPDGFYIMNSNGTGIELLLERAETSYRRPHFSPDGKSFAFDTNYYRSDSNALEICVYNIENSALTRLTFGILSISSYDVSWTP